MNELVSDLNREMFGVDETAPAAPAPAPEGRRAQIATPEPAPNPATKTETQTVSDNAPSAKESSGSESFLKLSDGKVYTSHQIESLLGRYRDLNYRHAQLKPVISMSEQVLQQTPGLTPDGLVQQIIGMAKAQQHNPTLGTDSLDNPASTQPQMQAQPQIQPQAQGGIPGQQVQPQPQNVTDYRAWEEQNSVSLPPGYEQMSAEMSQMKQMLMASQQTVMQLSQSMQAAANQAAAPGDPAQEATARQVSANLTYAQQQLGLDKEQWENFKAFSADRGYIPEEDFVNDDLVMRVMTDFKNSITVDEVERLKSIEAKRRAYMTAQAEDGGNASANNANEAPTETDKNIQNMTEMVMQQRGTG